MHCKKKHQCKCHSTFNENTFYVHHNTYIEIVKLIFFKILNFGIIFSLYRDNIDIKN